MTDLELVTDLRRAIHARSVRGNIKRSHDHHRPGFPLSYASKRIEERQTMQCGGVSYWLYHTYRNLGFPAFVINTGQDEGDVSHVMTFVRIAHDGRHVWTLQDAFLNMTYVDEAGGPMCLTDIHDALARRCFETIVASVCAGPAPVSLRHLESDPVRFEVVMHIAARQGLDLRLPSEDVVYLEWNYHSFPAAPFRNYLRTHFDADHLALLLALPLGTSGERYAEDFMTRGREVYEQLAR